MRIVVFGGTGFVGRALVPLLAKEGWEIIIPTRSLEKVKPLKVAGSVGQITGVLSGTVPLEQLLQVDAVVNLIGILQESQKGQFRALQQEFPTQLARIAASIGVRKFVHVSALGAEANSSAVYARTKAAGEVGVREAFPSATILRPSLIVGVGDDFFGRFAAMTRTSPFLPLPLGGYTKFQPVWVGDVVAAIMAALKMPEAAGKTYTLAGKDVYTFAELLQLMLQVLGKKRLLLNVPKPAAWFLACVTAWLPKPPLTRDQLFLLETDNVMPIGALGLEQLGITPASILEKLPQIVEGF